MTQAVLLTVFHTGTKYFLDGLTKHHDRATYSHLNKHWRNKTADVVYTTYRDPLSVAASWLNRGRKNENSRDQWVEQWTCYRELQEVRPLILDFTKGRIQHGIEFAQNPINAFPDKGKFHNAITEGNTDYIYRYMPKDLIDLAYECSEWAVTNP